MDVVEVWPEVRHFRWQFADLIESLDERAWNFPSWCEGWRVRDVLAHLVHLAEATQLSMAADMIRGGLRPDRTLREAARRLGDVPVPELTHRLRASADGRFHVFGSPASVALGEMLVHGADALRPLDLELDGPPSDAAGVLDAYWRIGQLAFHGALHKGLTLKATDFDWTKGRGPEVRGRAIDLLLLVANRRQVLPCLDGPGLSES